MATYDYNSEGLRTKKTTANGVENYVYFSRDLEYITDENNNLKYSLLHDNDGRYVGFVDHTSSTPTVYHYVLNYRGDVIGIKDVSGNMVVSYSYDNFGNILNSTGTTTLGNGKLLKEENPIRYASYQYDNETTLYYVKARYYNAELGRFTSRDPVFQDNLYVYGDNNPVIYVDQDGNNPLLIAIFLGLSIWTIYDIYKDPSIGNIALNLLPFKAGKFLKPFHKPLQKLAKKGYTFFEKEVLRIIKSQRGSLDFSGIVIINSKYAGKVFYLMDDLAVKYPKEVKFKKNGFPDFSPYSVKTVKINDLDGTSKDFTKANRAAGYTKKPNGYT